jgi:alcohol dehydrogenase class IV
MLSTGATSFSDALGLEALQLLVTHLPRSARSPDDRAW